MTNITRNKNRRSRLIKIKKIKSKNRSELLMIHKNYIKTLAKLV